MRVNMAGDGRNLHAKISTYLLDELEDADVSNLVQYCLNEPISELNIHI